MVHLHTHIGTGMRFLLFQLFEQKGGNVRNLSHGGIRYRDSHAIPIFPKHIIYIDESHTAIITPNISMQCIQMK